MLHVLTETELNIQRLNKDLIHMFAHAGDGWAVMKAGSHPCQEQLE